MTLRAKHTSEMPGPGEGRPLGGERDSLDILYNFGPTFELAGERVTATDSDTRRALPELVCILSTRLHDTVRLRMEPQRVVDIALTRPHPHLRRTGLIAAVTGRATARFDRFRNLSPVR